MIIHDSDNGIVDCLIFDDGKIYYECSKCRRMWRSLETSQEDLNPATVNQMRRAFEAHKRTPPISRLIERRKRAED